jgi:hypothetical protein
VIKVLRSQYLIRYIALQTVEIWQQKKKLLKDIYIQKDKKE